jgi:carboxymethylenebutenolidase
MPPLDSNQMYLIEECADEFKAQRMDRRRLIRNVLMITGSVPLTATLLTQLGCGDDDGGKQPAQASGGSPAASPTAPPAPPTPTTAPAPTQAAAAYGTVTANDTAIKASDVKWPGPANEMLGYLVMPSAAPPAGGFAGVFVIHDNRGLDDFMKDVVRRYAKAGFAALGIDLLSRFGGTKPDITGLFGQLGQLESAAVIADMQSGVDYFKKQTGVKPTALGVTGFCIGGNWTWEMVTNSPDIKAAVPFYGMVRELDKLATTKVKVFANYASEDARLLAQKDPVEEKLKASGTPYVLNVRAGAQHGFFRDGTPQYNEGAARAAWADAVDWFRKSLV